MGSRSILCTTSKMCHWRDLVPQHSRIWALPRQTGTTMSMFQTCQMSLLASARAMLTQDTWMMLFFWPQEQTRHHTSWGLHTLKTLGCLLACQKARQTTQHTCLQVSSQLTHTVVLQPQRLSHRLRDLSQLWTIEEWTTLTLLIFQSARSQLSSQRKQTMMMVLHTSRTCSLERMHTIRSIQCRWALWWSLRTAEHMLE